jgi:predicted phage gp36 major capsid-like protein
MTATILTFKPKTEKKNENVRQHATSLQSVQRPDVNKSANAGQRVSAVHSNNDGLLDEEQTAEDRFKEEIRKAQETKERLARERLTANRNVMKSYGIK